jgi:hypothetical protein
LYHKLKKKDKDREEKKLREYMEEIDPEAAKAYREKEELKVIEERLRVRHGTTSKFAKNLKRFKNMDDKDTRDAYHQAIQDRNALLQKTKQTTAHAHNESSEDMSDVSSEDEQKNRSKAAQRIRDEIDSEEQVSGSEAESDGENSEYNIDFGA